MGDVIDRWRINQGWSPLDQASQQLAIMSWVATLDKHSVPHEAYTELYERAITSRAIAMQGGKTVPQFGVEALLAGWLGEHGLQHEYARRRFEQMVAERRYLSGDPSMPDEPIVDADEGYKIMMQAIKSLPNRTESDTHRDFFSFST